MPHIVQYGLLQACEYLHIHTCMLVCVLAIFNVHAVSILTWPVSPECLPHEPGPIELYLSMWSSWGGVRDANLIGCFRFIKDHKRFLRNDLLFISHACYQFSLLDVLYRQAWKLSH